MLKEIIKKIIGKIKYQPLFEKLYRIGLKGMNYGSGDYMETSGELNAITFCLINKKDNVVFDVGANIGKYTSTVHGHLGSKITAIHAFEPSRRTYSQFLENTKSISNLHANQLALSSQNGSLTLYSDMDSSGLASVYDRDLSFINKSLHQTENITTQKLDSYCEEHTIHVIDFLKMDVEGHELDVLKGSERMIKERNIKAIQFEFGGCNIDSRTYFKDFFTYLNPHYNLYRIVKDGIVPIDKYREDLEIFMTINYLAILRNDNQ
jgi:FkbM family methyltransferase